VSYYKKRVVNLYLHHLHNPLGVLLRVSLLAWQMLSLRH
jgi:hypothetical protein